MFRLFEWMGEALDIWYSPFALFIDPIYSAFGGSETTESWNIPILNDFFDPDFILEDEEDEDANWTWVIVLVLVLVFGAFLFGITVKK